MIRSWRFWVLLSLFIGPIAVYVGLGFLWLQQKGWWYVIAGFAAWTTVGSLFYLLGVRWTKSKTAILPPLDWESPRTFNAKDRAAWKIVEEEAERGEALPMSGLTQIDYYVDTGKRLASRLAKHYHPNSEDPIEHVPIVQALTALELAADDLEALCREIPGGDMITSSHWKKAVQAAGFFSKANEIYGYVLPLFQPATGIVRLGTQKLVTGPAWKNMQQNAVRWFYRAYVNRLGTHLIELYSGRLAIGAEQYRRLTKKPHRAKTADLPANPPLDIAVVGARDSGRTTLIAALDRACDGDLSAVKRRLEADGFDENLAELLKAAEWIEIDGYTVHPTDTARDRSTRRNAIRDAVDSDLVLLVIDGRRDDLSPEVRFVEAWDAHYVKNDSHEIPPLFAVLTGADRLANDAHGGAAVATRARIDAARKTLPPSVIDVFAVGLGTDSTHGVSDRLLLGIAPILPRAERVSINRQLRELTGRSKARRLLGQVGIQGKRLFQSLRTPKKR